VSADGKVRESYRIEVLLNISRLRDAIKKVAPGAKISVDALADTTILKGSVSSPAVAENILHLAELYVGGKSKILNLMKVDKPSQVYLRVQVVEMSRDMSRDLGLNWNAVTQAGSFNISYLPTGLTNVNNFNFSGSTDITVLINALEQQNLLTILSEPNLTALSGETASFLAGGEFPIVVANGFGTPSVSFKNFGVSLTFVPTLLEDGMINLRVRPEVSELSDTGAVTLNGITIPALTTRRADTTVELHSGQSFAIAGLLQSNMRQLVTKYPGLGDIPVLGLLFRSQNYQRNETELVIIVTPYVVKPINGKFALPTDEFKYNRMPAPHSINPNLSPGTDTEPQSGFMYSPRG